MNERDFSRQDRGAAEKRMPLGRIVYARRSVKASAHVAIFYMDDDRRKLIPRTEVDQNSNNVQLVQFEMAGV